VRAPITSLYERDPRLHALLENLRLVVVGMDCLGKVEYVNPFFLELTGYARKNVVGKPWFKSFIPERERQGVGRVFAEFVEREFHPHYQNSILMRGGAERLIAWNNTLLRDRSGRAIGVLSLGEDITEQTRVEAALVESQERLARILETVADGIYLVDQQGHMTFANKEAEKTVGATRDQLKQLRYDDPAWKTRTVEGKPFPEEEQPYVRVMTTGQPVYGVEQSIERPDGTRIVVSINAAPLHDASGKMVGEVGVMTDITQRKVAEEALADMRRLFNAMMNGSPDSIYFKDSASRFTRINNAQARVLGVKDPADAMGKTDFDFFAPEHAREAFADEQRIIETGIPIVGKLEQIRQADGSYRWVTATKAPIRDSEGRVIGTFGISRDVHEEKQLEGQLQHVKEYLETLIESANDIIYTLDAQGRFTFANQRAEQVTGFSSDQFLGHHFLGIVAPEDRDEVAERMRMLPPVQPQSLHFRLVSASQELVEVAVNTTPILEHGEWVGTLCIARDMTEKNRLERTIREERDRLDAILRSMAEAVLVTDANYRLILMNRAAEELVGIPRQELIGMDLDSITLPITRADLDRQLSHAPAAEGPYSRARAWGSRMLDVVITTLSDARGRPAGTVSLVRDVTELMRVDQMKSEFISLVSHELRTPLTSVKGYTDLILAGDAGSVNAEQQEFLGIVKANIDHLILMVNDLLDISRIEAGRIKLLPGSVELTPLVGEIIRSMRPQWEAKSQIVSAELPKTLAPLFADRDRLSQILGNLLSNAQKYSPSHTRIRILVNEAQANRVTASSPDLIMRRAPMLAISVEDQGIGIEVEDQQKLFSRFHRVDNSLTREIGGTGLGLAITKSFVEMHGGRVWVESPLDPVTRRGSRFTFTIPIVE
jgi:PAS domain S-box-containing protein